VEVGVDHELRAGQLVVELEERRKGVLGIRCLLWRVRFTLVD
jgi:hypothetical protein